MATYPDAGSENWYLPLKTYIDDTAAEAAAGGGSGGPVSWESVTGKPAAYPPAAHTHPAADVTESATRVFVSPAQRTKIDSAVVSSSITSIVALTQAAYDALPTKVATTLYVING